MNTPLRQRSLLYKSVANSIGLSPVDNHDEGAARPHRSDFTAAGGEDLPYKVELWDLTGDSVDQVLAITANITIGYAAYSAAKRDHPDRFVTLRNKDGVIWRNEPKR